MSGMMRAMMAGASAAATDPYWANVSALLHFEGANNSTTFTDQTGKTWGGVVDAVISTAQFKYGSSSGYWPDGSASPLICTSTDILIASADFTVEYWVYQTTAGTSSRVHAHFFNSAGNNNGLNINRNYSTGMLVVDNGLTATTAGTIAIPLNTWTHIAVVRDSGTIRGYVGGVQALSHAAQSYPAIINQANIGAFKGGLYRYQGYIDDSRITNGVCRYPSGTTFTPPTSAFPDS